MRRILGFLLVILLMFGITLPCYAEETSLGESDSVTGNVYAKNISAVEYNDIPVVNGKAETTTENGYTISVTGVSGNAVVLRVVLIPSSETAAWSWFADCIDDNAAILSILDIYFEDSKGNRINADGVNISILGVNDATTVFSVMTNRNTVELNCTITSDNITFTANGSHYYVVAKKAETDPTPDKDVTIENPEGGTAEISGEIPEAGDILTITPIPDDEKEVDEVIIKDEDGNEISVTDNGKGSYSHVVLWFAVPILSASLLYLFWWIRKKR